ncbi:NACHT domain-containing protein [Pseudomonas sp. B21-009]|uniref:NACHT domain-containing protein n=1 Tax=Pseudomonas sp. B21-009 TaxID=2895470 RepID=UPI00215F98B3|nr:NACHT domain-containing protein [Pseudomonas sp. B21-009]UVM66142.1 NACHT domain-containing protein [Pseudomonas sp. B21-009]
MTKTREKMDSVRASRDGHEFHEAWVARKCLGLLLPRDKFIGVAIEGFSPIDQTGAEDAGNEIADAVLYYGNAASFEQAHKIVVVQVKYSKASEDKAFRAADAKKTIDKFAKTYRSHKTKYGTAQARDKLRFELVTNRPILGELDDAVAGIIAGTALTGTAKQQADQVKAACKLKGKDLVEFVSRLRFTGLRGDLRESKHRLAVILADWAAARDPQARVRLNSIRELARDKANLANQRRNVISRADILTALELQDEHDLMPCPASFPDVGAVLERSQLSDVVAKIPQLNVPLAIHADGGIGKTVFLNSIAGRLAETHEIVLFDCYGMGQYRAPGDARHLPRKGLVHIVNELACRGFCDPLLPGTDNSDDLIRVFRLRMNQAAETVRRFEPDRQLILLLDAIDNAGEQARDRGETSFPALLLASLTQGDPIPGVQLVVSTRTHRRAVATGDATCEQFELQPFTIDETREFLRTRLIEQSEANIQVAQSRSRGNARVLEHLVADAPVLLASSERDNVIQLDELLRKRIESALKQARKQGYRDLDINTFLTGLASLPPPVPVREFAEASGLEEGAIASFAADLSPLLEHTKHGLMFRDEPTETLIRDQYCANKDTLRSLANNLLGMQATSIYAATTLPDLLQQLEDGERLFDLAFDERTPTAIKSPVSRQAIRHARLRAAVAYAAEKDEANRLVPLLVELSTLAAVDQRGTDYILDNPDLAVFSGDADSIRRLFELRTHWPGTRHARLTIAYGLGGDLADAYHHAHRVREWRTHWLEQDRRERQLQHDRADPTALDMAAVPFCYLIKGEIERAAGDLAIWMDWYAFEVAETLVPLLRLGADMGSIQSCAVDAFVKSDLLGAGTLAALIPFVEGDSSLQQALIRRLAEVCEKTEQVRVGEKDFGYKQPRIIRGLLRAASVALVQGMKTEASQILAATPIPAPSLYVYMSDYWSGEVYSFLAKQALLCVSDDIDLLERQLLPQELADLIVEIPTQLQWGELMTVLKAELQKQVNETHANDSHKKAITADTKSNATRFLAHQLDHWLTISRAFAACFSNQLENGRRLTPLLEIWPELLGCNDYQSGGTDAQRQRLLVADRLLTLTFEAAPSLEHAEVVNYLDAVKVRGISDISHLISIVGVLAVRPEFHVLAGATANAARLAIEQEDEVNQRATLFADLARAVSPASQREAAVYFHRGLEQMDAVGSGDYQFVNELMQFAASLHGEELSEEDSHTLSNICELNLGDEENKFNWGMYGMAMATVSGLKGLAKLARWEDRGRVTLDYTLLPYLRALIHWGKIDATAALAILRTASPAELFVCGTEQLIETLVHRQPRRLEDLTQELITQYQQNNPHGFSAAVPRALAGLASSAFGAISGEHEYLTSLADRIEVSTREYNDLNNWRGSPVSTDVERRHQERVATDALLASLVLKTDPVDELSLADALEKLQQLNSWGWSAQRDFFEQIQAKISYGKWSQYVTTIARQEQLTLHEKLRILSACKTSWSQASNALASALYDCAAIIIRQCADEFVSFGRLNTSDIDELSAVSGMDRHVLILELIKEFSRPNFDVPASVWLNLATTVNESAVDGVGQAAIHRLLNTGAAKLALSVVDGPWQSTLYPTGDQAEVAAGLIWFALGSPQAERRWMAAHALRVAMRLGHTDILDKVVMRFDATDAACFQAPELPFFHLHAKLWLLIALARIALDQPVAVSKYHPLLERVALDAKEPHVLFKHFSAQALLTCNCHGHLTFEQKKLNELERVNLSPYPIKKLSRHLGGSFYKGRPEGTAKPLKSLHLDYDFGKYDVTQLGEVFGQAHRYTENAMNQWVRQHDAEITHMSDQRGRAVYRRGRLRGFSSDHHSYGEQLCWHALHAVAGEFLSKLPVVQGPYDDVDPWEEWLSRRVLTRKDGLWLADATDRRPLATRINLREVSGAKVGLTGASSTLQSLLGINDDLGEWLVVDGEWKSIDGIDVHIRSALVSAKESTRIAADLTNEEPFQAYIPRLDEYEDTDPDAARSHSPFIPWVVDVNAAEGLDASDTLGVGSAASRLKLASHVNAFAQITAEGPYGRRWVDPSGAVLVHSETWSQQADRYKEHRSSGTQLRCRTDLLQRYLTANSANLLILIVLRQYEPGFGNRSSRSRHTVAVVEVTESLTVAYHPGRSSEFDEES